MKIAFVIQNLSISGGGAERFSNNLIRGLISRDHDISVYCYGWDEKAEKSGVALHKLPSPSKWRHSWFELSKNFYNEINKKQRFDVIFGLTQLCPQDVHRLGGGVYRYWYEQKYGKLLPFQMLRGRVRKALEFEKEMYSLPNYKQLITISEMDRKILMDYYNVPPERVQTVYNGFDFSEFNYDNRDGDRSEFCLTYNIDPQKTIILFAANNYIRKGLPQAVDSILQTGNPDNFALVVIGRGRTSVKKNLQRKLSGKTQAVWLDHVNNPAKYYRSADVFLFPTLYDSFANVIGEALACGLPVITTQQAGGAEMILRDENGFVAKHATAENDLSNYLEKFTDRDLCAAFSKRAPEIVSQYTIDRCAAETEKVLLKALSTKSGD